MAKSGDGCDAASVAVRLPSGERGSGEAAEWGTEDAYTHAGSGHHAGGCAREEKS